MKYLYPGALVVMNPLVMNGKNPLVIGQVVSLSRHYFAVQWSNSPPGHVFTYHRAEVDLVVRIL